MQDLNKAASPTDGGSYNVDELVEFTDVKGDLKDIVTLMSDIDTIARKIGTTGDKLKEQLTAQKLAKIEEIRRQNMSSKELTEYIKKQKEATANQAEQLEQALQIAEAAGMPTKEIKDQLDLSKKRLAQLKQEERLNRKNNTLAGKYRSEKAARAARKGETEEQKAERKAAAKELREEAKYNLGSNIVDALKKGLNKLSHKFTESFQSAESILTSYNHSMNARLQGTDRTYKSMAKLINSNVSLSRYVEQQKVLENLNKAVNAGIVYNVELRAYLDTLQEGIVGTFDAFSADLTRLVRQQQSDSTTARLGMETALDKTLNSWFLDSAYLSDQFDNVTNALLDLELTMTKEGATELEYVAQKWLGSLYSVGASGSMVQAIANAINMLGTGNVQGLASNSQMQALLAMSASRGGLDYAQMLTEGIDASDLNTLMKSMIEYLSQIANSTNSNVVASAYGDVFGVGIADLKSILNLVDVGTIYQQTLTYADAYNEVNNQIANLSSRYSLVEQMNNALSNAVFSSAQNIVTNTPLYILYKALGLIEDVGGDNTTFGVSAAGFGVTIGNIASLAKSAMVGISTAVSLAKGVSNMFAEANGTSLDRWNAKDTLQSARGSGFNLLDYGGESYSTSVGNASSADMESGTINDSYDKANKYRKNKKGTSIEEEHDITDLYTALFDGQPAGVLTLMGTDITDMKTNIAALRTDIEAAITENMFNMNITAVNGKPVNDGLPIMFSDDKGYLQLSALMSAVSGGLGLGGKTGGHTLQEFIEVFLDNIYNEDTSALNVNLAGNEVEATSFLTNSVSSNAVGRIGG